MRNLAEEDIPIARAFVRRPYRPFDDEPSETQTGSGRTAYTAFRCFPRRGQN
jgi:hypothetical protein